MTRALVTIASAPTSQIRCYDGAGHGAVNTKVRMFNQATTIGTAITTTQTANSGREFTINEAGVYMISYSDARAGGASDFGISLNSAQLTTSITVITAANRLIVTNSPAAALIGHCSVAIRLAVGDVVRPHTDGLVDATTDYQTMFVITQMART